MQTSNLPSLSILRRDHASATRDPINVNIAIGNLAPEQLDLSSELLKGLGRKFISAEGIDVRTYELNRSEGLLEARKLMGGILSYPHEEVLVHGNSSLKLMEEYIRITCGARIEQLRQEGITPRMLIPAPGFFRHFELCKNLGISVIPLLLDPHYKIGIDTDDFDAYVEHVPGVIGMICVPKYANPTGHVFPPFLVKTIAELPLRNPDMHIFWDNAYACHDLYDHAPRLYSVRSAAIDAGTEDSNTVFGTTSKITFSSSGIAAACLSPKNFRRFKEHLDKFTLGPDREVQLRHARFFEKRSVEQHMKMHADIVRPKFEALLEQLEKSLGGRNLAYWTQPEGGFFISMYVVPGTAKRVIELCGQLDLKLTPAGACFPDNRDPFNSHIRIAPSAISMKNIGRVAQALSLCVQLAAAEKEQRS